MAQLRKYLPFNSLFVKMLMYFLIVIILLSVYNIWTMSFYSSHVSSEIVKYNRTMMRNTVDSFEKQYTNWKNALLNLQHNEFVKNIDRQAREKGKSGIDYLQVNKINGQIRSLVSNTYYNLDNVIIRYNQGFLIEKDGSVSEDRMFGHFYTSEDYPLSFWKQEKKSSSFLEALPASRFIIKPEGRISELLPLKTYVAANNWEIIALVDVKKWYQSYKGLADSHFFLLDSSGRLLFQSATEELDLSQIPDWDGKQEWILSKGTYYFFEQGESSGFTYVNVIPHRYLHQSISKMNWIAILLFGLTLLIGIGASLFFSRTINRPLKSIIQGLNRNEAVSYNGSITEFNAISSHLKGLQKERSQIKDWIESSKPLLTNYNYMARFKKLDLESTPLDGMELAEGAFTVVVYQLRYRRLSTNQDDRTIYKLTRKIKEMINIHVQEAFPLSHTFQMESYQILSVIYANEEPDALKDCLENIKHILDHDHEDYLVTIGVSSLFQQSADFDQAYSEALSLIRLGKPLEETQIIWEMDSTLELTGLTPEQEQEFLMNLQAGNLTACRSWVSRIIEKLERDGATADQVRWFADYVLERVQKVLDQYRITTDELVEPSSTLSYCATAAQYHELLEKKLTEAADAIQLKLEKNYGINQHILGFLETHYAEDISLDILAQKFNMSPTYLSGYIKENTGSNFSEHLNAIRIRKAKELLETTDLSIQEIGTRIGYRNVTSFIRMFKKETGHPPGDYRKKHQLRDNG
ncbi:helix-turn-helix domain-containing protein [Paenibacillus dakarensis]|uniref:helix-turn-helix domain-containing protein n=1 Tax=Paenibacillus dakarensis TaxID=1527293 RepID=UPI0006D532E9|nr:helix-turn-helix domain-containing protein [Paenibacillus dakarensis]